MHLKNLSLLVDDYDRAIDWYVNRLGFELREDRQLNASKRWVRVAPPDGQTSLLLAKAATTQQQEAIGDQSGGRVFLFLEVNDFDESYADLKARGVEFVEKPRDEPYGKVAVFLDLYGNRWDLIETRNPDTACHAASV